MVMLLTFGMVSVWGSRLAYHIGSRHTHGEDYRYTAMRKRWEHLRFLGSNLYSFLWVFGMQGFFSMIVNASALHILKNSTKNSKFGKIGKLGGLIWLTGFLMEAIGDW